jgi:hypothetical protein
MVRMLGDGQRVRVNLAGLRVGSVVFQAAVTDAVGTIVRQVSQDPPTYLVKLLFSFRGVDEVEVPPGSDRCQVSSLNERIPSIPEAALHDSLSIQETREKAKHAT